MLKLFYNINIQDVIVIPQHTNYFLQASIYNNKSEAPPIYSHINHSIDGHNVQLMLKKCVDKVLFTVKQLGKRFEIAPFLTLNPFLTRCKFALIR